ncbi:ester cyclase [Nocardia sp. NPDC057353]|uniref:ester cyclase n=1 Tax=Nocardia sp. NPDC057353 TaxID=3346104 RepID=UPI003643B2B3
MTTTTQTNKDVARRFYHEVITEGQLHLLDEIIAEDGTDSAVPAGSVKGRGGFVEHITWLRANVENVTATVVDTVAEDDRVVVYWTIEGTQRGELFGVPDTGRHFTGFSISTIRFRDGRIVEYSVLPDRAGIIAQLAG